jgi:hypothetical protein
MAGRHKKNKVDYFPHYCNHGKTLFILENQYGNDGYAFWFKTLEILGKSEGHYYDCKNPAAWQFLLAHTRVKEEAAEAMLKLLSELDAIDRTFWTQYRVIWSSNFRNNISDAYTRRQSELPTQEALFDIFARKNGDNVNKNTNSDDINHERRRKEKKGEYTCDSFFNLWNQYASKSNLINARELSDSRKQKIATRLRERPLEKWDEIFSLCARTPFLNGLNKENWRASFDWIAAKPDNGIKVLEARYGQPEKEFITPDFVEIKKRKGTDEETIADRFKRI